MPRRRRLRNVVSPPGFKGYRPYGCLRKGKNHVDLLYEEYEAIKLADYDLMNHQEAASVMGISRATFARIYEVARRKLAQALVETREIKTAYGNASLENNWYICNLCSTRFTSCTKSEINICPICRLENTRLLTL